MQLATSAASRTTMIEGTLVRPGKPIPPGASAIHHIIDEDLKDALALSEVIDRFRGADVYVAHNCEF
jgi:exodeoxyribonuclease X